jgi:TetR/AcrR family transcriptional regulator, tetracycline repressor protein
MPGADAPANLDRRTIVEAGCRLVERVGAKALTMRMLAEELGVSPMAAYRHVPSKSALLLLIVNDMMARVKVPPATAGPWDTRLRLVERAAFAELSKAPDLWDLVPGDAIYPEQERLTGAVQDILLEAGFDAKTAVLALETFFGYVLGQLRMRQQLASRPVRRSRHGREGVDPKMRFGAVVVGGREQVIGFDEYFDFGLRVLLNGLRAELEAAGDGAAEGVTS